MAASMTTLTQTAKADLRHSAAGPRRRGLLGIPQAMRPSRHRALVAVSSLARCLTGLQISSSPRQSWKRARRRPRTSALVATLLCAVWTPCTTRGLRLTQAANMTLAVSSAEVSAPSKKQMMEAASRSQPWRPRRHRIRPTTQTWPAWPTFTMPRTTGCLKKGGPRPSTTSVTTPQTKRSASASVTMHRQRRGRRLDRRRRPVRGLRWRRTDRWVRGRRLCRKSRKSRRHRGRHLRRGEATTATEADKAPRTAPARLPLRPTALRGKS
mmetsp:Transcript_42848/g.118443  ORF Transcript_42848/g.118443 Transcript_42848/m.118443 type:complete len:268 (-) Transcript_42848:464-1267(-)